MSKAAALALLVLLAGCGGNDDDEQRPQCFTAECVRAAPACIPSPDRTCEENR